MPNAIEVHGLGKRYGRKSWALGSIDFLQPGSGVTALVGPNGAGKSTLIRSLAGFERPTVGTVRVAGFDPWTERADALADTGYVAQTPTLYSHLTIDQHLQMAEQLRAGFDRGSAATRLADLGIHLSTRGAELSGGQQAQVVLSLALGTGAKVLLLDEPLAALDPLARREFLYTVAESAREHGTAVLLASHVVTDVEQACNRLVVLGAGRVLLDSSIDEVLASHTATEEPGGPLVASFRSGAGSLYVLRRPPVIGSSERVATLEEVVLAYLASASQGSGGKPS